MIRAAAAFGALAVLVALVLVTGQGPFDNSTFEFGVYRSYEGTVLVKPFAMLLTPGGAVPLVAPGKWSADESIRRVAGGKARFEASLIRNGDARMLELKPESVRSVAGEPDRLPPPVELGAARLTGEIVDTKCHFGVMNPGRGKVHKACAIRCLRGGIPPGFLVRDENGAARTLLLTGNVPLDRIAEPVTLNGRLQRQGALLLFRVE